jgi:predicted nucleic acid-binding Zn ribbon protein
MMVNVNTHCMICGKSFSAHNYKERDECKAALISYKKKLLHLNRGIALGNGYIIGVCISLAVALSVIAFLGFS